MNKKADIWVSAVIYTGLAITILTIVLAAGMPVINRMRDKNIEIQTRDVMSSLDDTIRTVGKEGPGAQRTPVIKILRGEFKIIESNSDENSQIIWTLPNSKFMFSQPDVDIPEGNLIIKTTSSQVKDEYKVEIILTYDNIHLNSEIKILSGQYNLKIRRGNVENNKIQVYIEELTT